MNLYEMIVDEIHSDGASTEGISRRLISGYQTANEHEKSVIDDFFITLTGWSLKTLIEKSDKN